jgi:hypothetical protein
MAVDSDARTQLGNVLSVLPKKLQSFAAGAGYDFTSEVPVMENLFAVSDDQMSYISLKDSGGNLAWQMVGGDDGSGLKRFSPTAGYDFSSEVPASANLFAVSDAGLSYVSESDDQGVLSWRLVGDESTDIKRFEAPADYDFKSTDPTSENLLGVDSSGLSYLSVQSSAGGGGAQVPVGPTTFDMDLGSAGTSNWNGGMASFTYQGLDSNGYPYWEEDSDSSFRVEWFTDFTASPDGEAPLSAMWGYVLTYNGILSGDNSYGHDYIAYGFPFPALPAGEFWDLRDSSFTYTSVAGNDISVTLETSTMFGGSAYPHNFNGTEAEGGGGGGASLSWKKIGSDGTEIKSFTPPNGYDFTSEIPSSPNLLAVDSNGATFLSAQGAGTSINIGPSSFNIIVGAMGATADFNYAGLDSAGYPHWVATTGYAFGGQIVVDYKIVWRSDEWVDTHGDNVTGWFILDSSDNVMTMVSPDTDGALLVALHSETVGVLVDGEFWELSDSLYGTSSAGTYTSKSSTSVSIYWNDDLGGFTSPSGTETSVTAGAIAWQALRDDGTEIKRFSPTAGYDFSSEIPASANLFAVSDAGLSYVSESDDQGVLFWRLVGDESADIKRFTAPDGYDFKSELPTEQNLLGVAPNGFSYLSVEQEGDAAAGKLAGPDTVQIDVAGDGATFKTFAYSGLDGNNYPHWLANDGSNYKISWLSSFNTGSGGGGNWKTGWFLLNGSDQVVNVFGFHVGLTVASDSAISSGLSAGEFWPLSDEAYTTSLSYTTEAGVTLSLEWLPAPLSGFNNSSGTANVAVSGPKVLAWQSIGGGGGFGEGSPKGGPIFITGAYSSAGAVAREGDLQHEAVWTGMSTPEDSVEVSLLIERGDSQQYKPTGVYYYQTGQSSEFPNEGAPQYLSPDLLALSENGYSWEVDTEIPTSDSVMINDTAYYLFFNGEKSTEISIKRTSLPSVQSATFANKDGSHGEESSSSNGIYPKVGSAANGFTTPGGSTGFDSYDQSSVKSGDEVKLEIITDKPIDAVIFSSTEGAIRSLEINSASFYNGMSEDNGDGTWTSYIVTNINDPSSLSVGTNFTIKVKDEKGNLSESWHNSDNTIDVNNSSPSVTISSVSYPGGNLAIEPGGASANYTISAVDLDSADDYFQFELTDSSLVGLGDDHTWSDNSLLQDGQVVYVDVESPPSPEQSVSPFTIKILRMTNGSVSTFTSPSVLVQDSSDPVLSLDVDAVRSGPAGNEDEITITSNVSLKSLSDTNSDNDVFSDGTVISGSSAAQEVNAKTWKIKIKSFDSAVRESAFDVLIDLEKYSGSSSQTTVSSQVRGFVQREISKNGVEALSEIPIGAVVVNPAKIKSKDGSAGNITFKINTGNESNAPYNSTVNLSDVAGGSLDGNPPISEFGVSSDNSAIIMDAQARAQWSPETSTTVYITLEEVI